MYMICIPAALAWDEYVQWCKEEIEIIYKKYDTNNSNSLDRFLFLFSFLSNVLFFLLYGKYTDNFHRVGASKIW